MGWRKHNLLPYDGEAYLLENAISEALVAPLIDEVAWRQDHITLYGKTHPLPRLQAWYGDAGLDFTYSRIHLEALPWSDRLNQIRGQVQELGQAQFNSVLCNLYRDGRDKNGWHRDNEKPFGQCPTIASLSYGAIRRFSLRHLRTRQRIDLDLPSGSLLLMSGRCQHDWEHQIVATRKPVGLRLNLTFRYIVTHE